MYNQQNDIELFINSSDAVALIEVEIVHGSTPRDQGTWMLVNPNGIYRTIGGGQLENMAIEKARGLLKSANGGVLEMHVPLGPHIGQCCGGIVNLQIEVLDQSGRDACMKRIGAEMDQSPHIYVFGAGHVGRALAQALALLPLKTILIDTRENELELAPANIEARLIAMPEAEVRNADPQSIFIILTHDHALDFLIAREALSRGDATYVGMIGSKTKRATFRNWLRRENGSEAGIEHLVCPIGGIHVRDKRPEIIAALTVAEIVTYLDSKSVEDYNNDPYWCTPNKSGEMR